MFGATFNADCCVPTYSGTQVMSRKFVTLGKTLIMKVLISKRNSDKFFKFCSFFARIEFCCFIACQCGNAAKQA